MVTEFSYGYPYNIGTDATSVTANTTSTPTMSASGIYKMELIARDSKGLETKKVLTYNFLENSKPTFVSTSYPPFTKGSPYSASLNATDLDGDALTFNCNSSGTGLTVSGNQIQGTPTVSYTIGFYCRATDSKGAMSEPEYILIEPIQDLAWDINIGNYPLFVPGESFSATVPDIQNAEQNSLIHSCNGPAFISTSLSGNTVTISGNIPNDFTDSYFRVDCVAEDSRQTPVSTSAYFFKGGNKSWLLGLENDQIPYTPGSDFAMQIDAPTGISLYSVNYQCVGLPEGLSISTPALEIFRIEGTMPNTATTYHVTCTAEDEAFNLVNLYGNSIEGFELVPN